MPNQHKNPAISWHPTDPTLKSWIKAEAARREVTDKTVLDEMADEYRARRELLGKHVVHLDGDPRNNDPSNLEARPQP